MESETTYYAVDMKLSEEVEAIARKRGVAADMLINLLDLKERHGVISPRRAARIRDHLTRAIALSDKIVDPGKDDALREKIFKLNTLDLVCDKHELDWPIKGWKLKVPNLIKLLFTPGPDGGRLSARSDMEKNKSEMKIS